MEVTETQLLRGLPLPPEEKVEKEKEKVEEKVAAVLYTSGSTGTPRGVRIPFRALKNRLLWQWEEYPYQEGEVSVRVFFFFF